MLPGLAVLMAVGYCHTLCFNCLVPIDASEARYEEYQLANERLFSQINSELLELNRASGECQWRALTGDLATWSGEQLVRRRTAWRNKWCNTLTKISNTFSATQRRQEYLLCRGPKYTPSQARELLLVTNELESLYVSTTVCRGPHFPCYNIEPDLENLMKKSQDPAELLWGWHEWRGAIGPPARALYPSLIEIQNKGARNNGYRDIGACWREELEVDNLEEVAEQLFLEVQPLYRKLHAYVRYRLAATYHIEPKNYIPAHLLGNIWAQNWDALLPLLLNSTFDLETSFLRLNYSERRMVELAEEFYKSLGLPSMPKSFWRNSQFVKPANRSHVTCHGTAANMYDGDDLRLLMCASVSLEDFYVIHHEMGHLQYYMAYKDQPTIFQEGANSAFHEAVGDAVMLGVLSPRHLYRLGILDKNVPTEEAEIGLLLRTALNKLPQLAFGLVVDRWRWAVMRGSVPPANYSSFWWTLHYRYLGVQPPSTRTEDHFDPAAKSHITDNTPYIRYFLSEFLQMQFLEAMCNASPPITPLHLCDLYGSRQAGNTLMNMMRLGSSVQWQEALSVMTAGKYKFLSATPMLSYYQPLETWLDQQIVLHNIPVWVESGSD